MHQLVGLKVGLVAIERPDGLLVERLLDAGLRVLALHPDQVAATRAGFRGSGSSDTSQSRRRSYVTRVRDRLSHFSFGPPSCPAALATMQEPGLSAAEFRFDALVKHPSLAPRASTCPSSARRMFGRAAPEMLAQVREQGFVDSRALCVTPGAAVSWSARWWLPFVADQKSADDGGKLLRFLPTESGASTCSVARAGAPRACLARADSATGKQLATAALPRGELGPPVTWSALGGPSRAALSAPPTDVRLRGASSAWSADSFTAWLEAGQLAGSLVTAEFTRERRVRAVGGPLYVTLASRERAANRRVETPATVDPSSADPWTGPDRQFPGHTRESATIWSPRC